MSHEETVDTPIIGMTRVLWKKKSRKVTLHLEPGDGGVLTFVLSNGGSQYDIPNDQVAPLLAFFDGIDGKD